ncbi:MAG: metallophosphoesterase [Clostridia bacterium]|nr:metallophosphoesterase [Clostridia bacterium]
MVKLGIVSDSHDTSFPLERFLAIASREKYDAVFHLGDGRGDVRWLERRLSMPFFAVAGNCDFYSKASREIVCTFDGHRILAVHGHLLDVKWGLDRLSYYAGSLGADIALYGHTHVPAVEYVGGVLTVNPGALMRSCYAELTLDGGRVIPVLKTI